MTEAEFTIQNKVGLHARPAGLFVETATKFASEITVENLTRGSEAVNAKSILSILASGVESGHTIRVRAEGEDEQAAVQALSELIAGNFGEE